MRTRGASVGITKKVLLTESEKYHNVLHIHDRDQMYHCVDIGIIYEVYDYMRICFLDLENPGIDALFF